MTQPTEATELIHKTTPQRRHRETPRTWVGAVCGSIGIHALVLSIALPLLFQAGGSRSGGNGESTPVELIDASTIQAGTIGPNAAAPQNSAPQNPAPQTADPSADVGEIAALPPATEFPSFPPPIPPTEITPPTPLFSPLPTEAPVFPSPIATPPPTVSSPQPVFPSEVAPPVPPAPVASAPPLTPPTDPVPVTPPTPVNPPLTPPVSEPSPISPPADTPIGGSPDGSRNPPSLPIADGGGTARLPNPPGLPSDASGSGSRSGTDESNLPGVGVGANLDGIGMRASMAEASCDNRGDVTQTQTVPACHRDSSREFENNPAASSCIADPESRSAFGQTVRFRVELQTVSESKATVSQVQPIGPVPNNAYVRLAECMVRQWEFAPEVDNFGGASPPFSQVTVSITINQR